MEKAHSSVVKVKLFRNTDIKALELEINAFMENLQSTILDIKFSTSQNCEDGLVYYSNEAMVIYKP